MADWMTQAACAGDLDFTERDSADQARLCAGCPVRMECLELGIAAAPRQASETVGYGGVGPEELVRLVSGRARVRRCRHCRDEFRYEQRSAVYCSPACGKQARGLGGRVLLVPGGVR